LYAGERRVRDQRQQKGRNLTDQELIEAVREHMAQERIASYGDVLAAIPGGTPERVAWALWTLRSQHAVRFVVRREGDRIIQFVEVTDGN